MIMITLIWIVTCHNLILHCKLCLKRWVGAFHNIALSTSVKKKLNVDHQHQHTLPLNDLHEVINLSIGMLHNSAMLIRK
jgi:hypothetical protein